MKKIAWWFVALFILSSTGTCLAEVPYQIGPYVLNRPVTEFESFLRMDTALPIRYMEYINEVEIKPIKGFKSGLIAYSTCETPGRVVRIKLKYADSSKKFYDDLLKRVEQRFGKSSAYRGDPFQIVVAWKWSFVDQDQNRINLILQHNSRDEEEKIGNSIKLTLFSKLEPYGDCATKAPKASGQPEKTMEIPGLSGWNLFLPQ